MNENMNDIHNSMNIHTLAEDDKNKMSKRLNCYCQLGLKIQFYRKKKGLTQLQLSEMINISRTYLSNIEAPKTIVNPTLDVIFDIADALQIPASLLFDNEKI